MMRWFCLRKGKVSSPAENIDIPDIIDIVINFPFFPPLPQK